MMCPRSVDGRHHYPRLTPRMLVRRQRVGGPLFGPTYTFEIRCAICRRSALVKVRPWIDQAQIWEGVRRGE